MSNVICPLYLQAYSLCSSENIYVLIFRGKLSDFQGNPLYLLKQILYISKSLILLKESIPPALGGGQMSNVNVNVNINVKCHLSNVNVNVNV